MDCMYGVLSVAVLVKVCWSDHYAG